MKTVRDLPLWPLWVNPEHRVKSALVMMRGHGVTSLGVIKGETFLGTISLEDLVGIGDNEPVELVMRRSVETVSPDLPLRRLAELMSLRRLDSVPVLHDEEFIGIVTAKSLLAEVWRSYDPLTQLPWSDSLRDWGIEKLQEGREVTILFFDLDSFGQYNKKYGHIVGDRVLQAVGEIIAKGTDPDIDQTCRYGGDEFAVATIRPRAQADELGAWLQSRFRTAQVTGADEPVSASLGISGGMRTKERENTHFAATLDNLVNLASQAAIANKPQPEVEPAESSQERPLLEPPSEPARPAIRADLLSARTTRTDGGVRAVIVLRVGSKLFTGIHVSAAGEAEAAAGATVKALQEMDSASEFALQNLALDRAPDGNRTITATVASRNRTRSATRAFESSEIETAARAVIDAAS